MGLQRAELGGRVGESQLGAERHEDAQGGSNGTGKESLAPHSLSEKNKPSELASELVRDGEWRQEGKVTPWFLPFCKFFTWKCGNPGKTKLGVLSGVRTGDGVTTRTAAECQLGA